MIVVDSSVLIDHLRGAGTAEAALWERVTREDSDQVLIGDLVLLEVLQGVRDTNHATIVERALRRFEVVSMLDARLASSAASHFRHLRGLGISVRRTVDLIIASFCIVHDHVLLHRDRDFAPMSLHLGLRTLASPLH